MHIKASAGSGEPIIIVHINGFSDWSEVWTYGAHRTNQNASLGISQLQTGEDKGFWGSEEKNSHLSEATFPGREILPAVAKNEASVTDKQEGKKGLVAGW